MPRERNRDGASFRYVQARQYLLDYIVDHDLQNGDLLPSMRDLGAALFEGKLKPVRTATEMLVEAQVLQSQRGRGVFVLNADLARVLSAPEGRQAAPTGVSAATQEAGPAGGPAIAFPFVMSMAPPTLRLLLAERCEPFRSAWKALIASYNARSRRATVEVQFGDPPDLASASAAGGLPDLIQLQAFRMQPFMRPGVLCELRGLGLQSDGYYANLMEPVIRDTGLFGLPISAVAYCLVLNESNYTASMPRIPEAWNGVGDYVDFLLQVAETLPTGGRVQAAVESRLSFLFYLTLAGHYGGDSSAGLPTFRKPEIRAFMRDFGRAFRRPDCFMRLAPGESVFSEASRSRSVLCGSHSYDLPPLMRADRTVPRYVPIPTGPGGIVPVVPHFMGITQQSLYRDECVDVLRFISGDESLRYLGEHGVLVPHVAGAVEVAPVLHQTLRHGISVREAPSGESRNTHLLQAIESLVARWQSGDLTLEQACEEIDARQSASVVLS